jgi:hypothetical protein
MVKSKLTQNLVKIIRSFEPVYHHGDLDWEFHFKLKGKWRWFHAKQYRETIYLFSPGLDSLEITTEGETNRELYETEQDLLAECLAQISTIYKQVKKDPIGYHRTLLRSLPPGLRTGIISRKFVNLLIPEYRPFHKELSRTEMRDILNFLKHPPRTTTVETLTAGTYFEYCRLAYLSNPEEFKGEMDSGMSGLEMYERWADGRDGGLSKLPLDNPEALREWYEDKGRFGDHPWEIYRGGNSTHIDLAIIRERDAWKIQIIAFASTRLSEACRIALALHKANLPFELAHADSYQKRLLAEDHVGILPEDSPIGYGWHQFPKEFDVADCIHYSWFKDEKNRSLLPMAQIKSLITWFPIRPLFAKKPSDA